MKLYATATFVKLHITIIWSEFTSNKVKQLPVHSTMQVMDDS